MCGGRDTAAGKEKRMRRDRSSGTEAPPAVRTNHETEVLEADSDTETYFGEEERARLTTEIINNRQAWTNKRRPSWVPSKTVLRTRPVDLSSPSNGYEGAGVEGGTAKDTAPSADSDFTFHALYGTNPLTATYEAHLTQRRRREGDRRSLVKQLNYYFPASRPPIDIRHGLRGMDSLMELEQVRRRSLGQVKESHSRTMWHKLRSDVDSIINAMRRQIFVNAVSNYDTNLLWPLLDTMFPETPGTNTRERERAEECIRNKTTSARFMGAGGNGAEMAKELPPWTEVRQTLGIVVARMIDAIDATRSGCLPPDENRPTASQWYVEGVAMHLRKQPKKPETRHGLKNVFTRLCPTSDDMPGNRG